MTHHLQGAKRALVSFFGPILGLVGIGLFHVDGIVVGFFFLILGVLAVNVIADVVLRYLDGHPNSIIRALMRRRF